MDSFSALYFVCISSSAAVLSTHNTRQTSRSQGNISRNSMYSFLCFKWVISLGRVMTRDKLNRKPLWRTFDFWMKFDDRPTQFSFTKSYQTHTKLFPFFFKYWKTIVNVYLCNGNLRALVRFGYILSEEQGSKCEVYTDWSHDHGTFWRLYVFHETNSWNDWLLPHFQL